MIEFDYLIIILFTLSIFQSLIGIGILVIGTPLLLLINYNILEIMHILLPVSICTSIINIIINKLIIKNFNNLFEKQMLINFFLICMPFTFFGLLLTSKLEKIINFDFLVSFIIFISLIIKSNVKANFVLTNKVKSISLSIIGIVHGLTNSGGTLMSLLILKKNKNNKKNSLGEIHFFYFLLSAFQYLILNFVSDKNYWNLENLYIAILLTLISTITSVKISKKINNLTFSKVIEIIAFTTSIFLIAKNII